jgi:hypothetical protein
MSVFVGGIQGLVARGMIASQGEAPAGDAPGPVGLVLEDAPATEVRGGLASWLIGPEGLDVTSPLVLALAGACAVVAVGFAARWAWPRVVGVGRLRGGGDVAQRTLSILARSAGLRQADHALLRRLAGAHPAGPSAAVLLLSDAAMREACTRLVRSDPASAAAVARLRERAGV